MLALWLLIQNMNVDSLTEKIRDLNGKITMCTKWCTLFMTQYPNISNKNPLITDTMTIPFNYHVLWRIKVNKFLIIFNVAPLQDRNEFYTIILNAYYNSICNVTGSAFGRRYIAPGFKPQSGYARRMFHLSLRLINFGGCSTHLTYFVHKSGHKTATFTFLYVMFYITVEKITLF